MKKANLQKEREGENNKYHDTRGPPKNNPSFLVKSLESQYIYHAHLTATNAAAKYSKTNKHVKGRIEDS